MIESPTVNKWKAQVRIQDLLGFLEARFGPVPADAKAKIEVAAALDVLRRWITLAGTATSLDEFRRTAGV